MQNGPSGRAMRRWKISLGRIAVMAALAAPFAFSAPASAQETCGRSGAGNEAGLGVV